MILDKKNVEDFKIRREESLQAALIKINDIFDFCKIYKMQSNIDMMKLIILDLKSKIFVDGSYYGNDEKNKQVRFIKTKESPEDFSDNVTALCQCVYENIILKEVSDFSKDINIYLDFAEPHQRAKCERSIDDIIGLFENSKNKKMDEDLFKIKQNLLGCLKYNDKIKNQSSLEKELVK